SGFHDEAASTIGVQNRGHVASPPLDRYVAELIVALFKSPPRARLVEFNQDDVAWAEHVCGQTDRRGVAPVGRRVAVRVAEDRDGVHVGVRANSGDAEAVMVAAEHAEHGSPMFYPLEISGRNPADAAARILQKVF